MIDSFIVLLYFIAILVIGLYNYTRSTSLSSYGSMKSSSTNTFILVATIFATAVGGGTVFGISEKAFSHDLGYTYALLLTVPMDLLIGIYLVPKLAKHYGAISMGDIMEKYYGKIGRLVVGIGAVFISVGYLSAQVNVSGKIFEYVLGVNRVDGVILSYIVVIIYTTIGGLRSVVFVNLLQFIAMIASIPLIAIIGVGDVGVAHFISAIPPEKYSLAEPTVLQSTILLSLNFMFMGFYPSFIQRTLINKDAHVTTSAIFIKSAVYVMFIACVTINGLLAFVMEGNINPSLAIPYMIDHIIPIGLKGFIVVGLLSAVMSTADSDLNIASISIVRDILQPLSRIKNQKILLLLARITTVALGSTSIVFALKFHNAVDLVIFAAGFWAPMILVPFVFGLYGIVVPVRNFVLTSAVGILSFISWEHFAADFQLKGVFVGTIASLGFFLISRPRRIHHDESVAT